MISWPHLISHLWFLQIAKRLRRSRISSKCQILRAFLALGCLLLKRVQSMSTGELYIHLFEDSRKLNLAKNVINEEWSYFNIRIWPIWKNGRLDKVMEMPIECGTHRLQKKFEAIFSLYNCLFSDILQLEVDNFLLLSISKLWMSDKFYCFIFYVFSLLVLNI